MSSKIRWDRPQLAKAEQVGDMPAPKGWRMRSKLAGRCPGCKAVYQVGDWILYLGKGNGVRCSACAKLRPL